MKPFQIIFTISLLFFVVPVFSQPVIIDVTTTPADCHGGATGSITFAVTGGTKPYYYYIIKGGVTQSSPQTNDTVYTFTNVEAGIYLCIIEDNNSLNDFRNRTVTQPQPIQITSVNTTPISCTGFADGKIDVTASGESGNYNFVLRPVELSTVTGSFDLIAPGNYRVVVSDASGCFTKDSTDIITFSDPLPVSVISEAVTDITCYGSNNGIISINASGGTGTYTFTLNPGGISQSSGTFTNLSPGTYTIEVTDINACPGVTSNPLTVNEPAPLQFTSQTSNNTSCFGVNDGTINVSASGGTAPYSFTLNPGDATNSTGIFTGLAPGTYTVSVTDSKSCGPETSNDLIISQPEAITITNTSSSDITCNNFDDGIIDVTASGGNAPLTYTLNPGAISKPNGNFTDLVEGTYTVTVTDILGCNPATTPPITIANPALINITGQTVNQITCNGAMDGAIIITAEGGTGTLSYTINPGGDTNNTGIFTGLEPGTYTVNVTDANSCPQVVTGIINIIEPEVLQISVDGSSKLILDCFGDNTGTININISGGTPPYAYSWTGPGGFSSALKDIAGLTSGSYNLTVTDSKSCVSVLPNIATITEPSQIQISLSKTDLICNGDASGTITVNASGGTPPYQYSLDGSTYQAGNIFTGLAKNLYTIYVRDNNSCVRSGNISVDEPEKLIVTSEILIDGNLCFGDALGEIRIEIVTGGTPPYEYSINGGLSFSSTSVYTNLPGGSYQTVVRDSKGCTANGNLNIINQPLPITITSYSQSNVTGCFGNVNGQINIEASGGAGSLSYRLNSGPPVSTGLFTGLGAGNYTITITDVNNCRKDTSVVISQPLPLIFTSLNITHVTSCAGDTNGEVQAAASGGTGIIQYRINGGSFQASGNFTGLPAGSHTLTIRDNNNCLKDTIFTITEPALLQISTISSINISCNGLNNGSISVVASGGTLPYSFTLNPGGTTVDNGLFNGLSQGTYTVSLTDNNGCGPVVSNPVTIQEPPPLVIDSVKWTPISCAGDANGQIQIYATGGTSPLQYSINNGLNFFSTSDFTNLGPGTFTPVVRDANNCAVISSAITLTNPLPITLVTESSSDVTDCFGNLNGSLTYEVAGGTGPIQYSLDGVNWQSTGIFTGLGGGTYVVIARDDMNCRRNSSELIIFQPGPLTADITSSPYINESFKGSINITNVSGGRIPYSFSINGMAGPFTSQTSYTGLNTGIYEVVVRDQNNCTYSRSVEIIAMPPLNVTVSLTHPTCHGLSNGSIRMTVTNPAGDLQYSIDDSVTWHSNNEFTNLSGRTYRIAVKESTGRYFSDVVTLIEPLPLNIMSTITPASCNAFSPDASITISVTGGTGTITYQWSDGPVTKDRFNVNSGTYNLRVTDQNGCETNRSIFVPANITVIANAGADTTVCEGSILTLNGTGGTVYSWSPATGLSNPNIANPTATITGNISYVLTVTGMNDCYNRDTINISIYPKLGLFAGNDTAVIKNNPVSLNATGGPYVSYLWQPATGLSNALIPNPVATPSLSQLYVVTAVDQHGCVEKDSIRITIIEDIVIYNSFSPNDDGINDYWDIDHAEFYPDIIVEVFSRWGEKLFSSRGYTSEKRWNGKHGGRPVPIGTYYYVVIPYKGAKALTGPLTIIR